MFTREEKDTLNSILTRFERRTSIEICIVTLDTFCVARERFDDMALHIANSWKVGKKGKNNGITICISSGYKRMKICNGKGVKKILSDSETKETIDNYFAPSFKNGNSYEGTLKGLNAIISMLGKRL